MILTIRLIRSLLLSCIVAMGLRAAQAAPAPPYVIGFSQCTMNDAWRQAMLAGMKKELNSYPDVEFRLKDAPDNSDLQQLREFLQEKIDLLIVSASSTVPPACP